MNKPVKTLSPHEALIYAMVTMAAADRTMTDKEIREIGDIVKSLPIFQGYPPENLVNTAEACTRYLEHEDGIDEILDLIADALPPRLYETAYAVAVEVAAVDLHVEQEELQFLQFLRDRLNIDDLVVAAIERSARVRFRKM